MRLFATKVHGRIQSFKLKKQISKYFPSPRLIFTDVVYNENITTALYHKPMTIITLIMKQQDVMRERD